MNSVRGTRSLLAIAVCLGVSIFGGGAGALLGVCGPFSDVAADAFCPFVLEIFTLGITTGTTPTTYDPTSSVSRLQMAAFLSRTVDGVLRRGSRRVALGQTWTPQNAAALGVTTVGSVPRLVRSDGADLWVTNIGGSTVSRVRGSDGKLLETWTGATNAIGVLVAMGRVFVSGLTSPGNLYRIDPTAPPGVVTTVATNLGNNPEGMTFDGARIWTANTSGSVSIVTPGATIPWTTTTVTGFAGLTDALYDGAFVWVTKSSGHLLKLDSAGAVLQTVTIGATPAFMAFDGANIWVPNRSANTVSVVRASTGAVLATLTGNGLSTPQGAAFDGERLLVTNFGGNTVSLWKAANLSPIGIVSTGAASQPSSACSDGVNFWIALFGTSQLARF